MIRAWVVDLASPDLARSGTVRADCLAPDERDRAAGKSPSARAEFVRARWVLRVLLGQALRELPGRVRIGRRARGQPWLPGHPDVGVSWSRSDGCLLLALSSAGPVGADIELLRSVRAPARVLGAVYPMAAALDGLDRPETFFSAWTLLEAAVKATGLGLAAGARQVELRGPVGGGPCSLATVHNAGARTWAGQVLRLTRPSGGELTAAIVHTNTRSTVDVKRWLEIPAPG